MIEIAVVDFMLIILVCSLIGFVSYVLGNVAGFREGIAEGEKIWRRTIK
jgi:hypothetical protein